jgi:DNA topoisomerase-1
MSYHREYFDEQPAAMYLIKLSLQEGHILYKRLSAIHKKTFQPTYSILESQAQHARLLKGEVARAGGGIIPAMDDDREGEAIAWHLCILCGLDPTCVPCIVFREITEQPFSAISKPETNRQNLVLAQQTRGSVLVGYKISPKLLWKYARSRPSEGTKVPLRTSLGLGAGDSVARAMLAKAPPHCRPSMPNSGH